MTIACIIPTKQTQNNRHLARCRTSLKVAATKKVQLSIMTATSPPTLKKPAGFGQLNNQAIDKALKYNPDYILLINDDAWVDKAFFHNFNSALRDTSPDIIVPLIYSENKERIDSFGVEYFTSGYAKNAPTTGLPTTLASASCLLVKASFLQKMKKAYGFYFNPILYYYLEDVEFCIRARAIGATIQKEQSLVAYHTGSATSGKKSAFTMYQTYRNILWLIIMTWPRTTIMKNLRQILLVQGWALLFGTWKQGIFLYPHIIFDTLKHLRQLLAYRKKTLRAYQKDFRFETLFSPYAFRTYHGITIK